MAYQNNIPQPTDRLKDSQADLLANFAEIYNLVGVNHVQFGASGQGKHKFVTMPVQSPAPTFAAGEVGIYNFAYNNQTNTRNELFVHKQLSSGTAEIPSTASILSQNSAPGTGAAGWTYLPSGILIKWISSSGNGLGTLNLPSSQPTFTTIFSVQLTPFAAGSGDPDFAVRFVSVIDPSNIQVYVSRRTSTGPAAGNFTALIIGN